MVNCEVYFVRTHSLRSRSSRVPGFSLGELVPRPDNAVLGGFPYASSDFRDFRANGPRMKGFDISTPSGGFVARAVAFGTTGDRRHGRTTSLGAADTAFVYVLAVCLVSLPGSAKPSTSGVDTAQ